MAIFRKRKRTFQIDANRFGPYHVVKIVHDGEKATVYQAEHRVEGDKAAIKAYKPEFNRAVLELRRKYNLPSEGQIGVSLTQADPEHKWPIVRVYGHGREFDKGSGNEYIVMEYVDGVNLKHLVNCDHEVLRTHGSGILRRVVRGLAALHVHKLIHRDFCTDNVIVSGGGKVTIIDLGFTAPTGIAFEERSGTPSYMAPEQVQAQPLTVQTDIYAFGVVMYEVLARRLPFVSAIVGDSPRDQARRHRELMDMHVRVQPKPLRQLDPEADPELEAIVMRCLAKDSGDRFGDMVELYTALAEATK